MKCFQTSSDHESINVCVCQVEASVSSHTVSSDRNKMAVSRLPGLCGRLKRRRVTVLVNLAR